MKLSVIIPCLNAADTIATQVKAFANQQWTELWEVIVVDNGSTDNTIEIVERYKEQLINLATPRSGHVDFEKCQGRRVSLLAI